MTLAMCIGLRVSEILGLRWEDVDLEDGKLQLRRSVFSGHVESKKTDTSETSCRSSLNWWKFSGNGG